MTALQTAPTDQAAGGKGLVKPEQLVKALTAVLPHACTEPTLPAICAVKVEAVDGRLLFIATDRYTIGRYSIDWVDGGHVDVVLPLASAKELLAYAKGASKQLTGTASVSMTFGERDVELFDFTRRSSLPLGEPTSFPRWRAMLTDDPGPLGEGIQYTGLNPVHLAKFSKAVDKHEVLRFTFGGSAVKPIRVEAGEHFAGVIMPVRVPATGPVGALK